MNKNVHNYYVVMKNVYLDFLYFIKHFTFCDKAILRNVSLKKLSLLLFTIRINFPIFSLDLVSLVI